MTAHFRTSTAVMQRRVEPATSLDFFPTPPWGTRAFCEICLPIVWPLRDLYQGTAWDPACGEGHMARVFDEYFPTVHASDIFDYGGNPVLDFVHPDSRLAAVGIAPDWIVTNPPFNLAADFIMQALACARRGVAMLVRSAALEGGGRYAEIYRRKPPHYVFQFVERLPMHRGRWVVNGKSATSYSWLVWLTCPPHDLVRWAPLFRFIPPSRKQLTRHDDWLRFGGCIDIPKGHAVEAWRVKLAVDGKEIVDDISDLRRAA